MQSSLQNKELPLSFQNVITLPILDACLVENGNEEYFIQVESDYKKREGFFGGVASFFSGEGKIQIYFRNSLINLDFSLLLTQTFKDSPTAFEFHAKSELLVVGFFSGKIEIFIFDYVQEKKKLESISDTELANKIVGINIQASTGLIATLTESGIISLIKASTGEILKEKKCHVKCLHMGKLDALSYLIFAVNCELYQMDSKTLELKKKFEIDFQSDVPASVCYNSHDLLYFVKAAKNKTLHMFQILMGKINYIGTLAFSYEIEDMVYLEDSKTVLINHKKGLFSCVSIEKAKLLYEGKKLFQTSVEKICALSTKKETRLGIQLGSSNFAIILLENFETK